MPATLSFNLLLSDRGAPSLEFCSGELSRSFHFYGWLWNAGDARTDGKAAWVEIADGDWQGYLQRTKETNPDFWLARRKVANEACGYLRISKDAEPEADDYVAFHFYIYVSREIVDAIDRAISAAFGRDQMVMMTIGVSAEVPADRSFPRMSNLDFGSVLIADILQFKLNPSAFRRAPAQPPRERRPPLEVWARGHRAQDLSIVLSGVTISGEIPWGLGAMLFGGKVERSRFPDLVGVDCVVVFHQDPGSVEGPYPAAGTFSVEPHRLHLNLFYRSDDLNGILKPLIEARFDDKISLSLAFLADEAMVRSALAYEADPVRGEITTCSISVSKRFGVDFDVPRSKTSETRSLAK
jgi:hypothetical protein